MQLSEFANPAQAVGQGANVAGDERIPDGVQWRVSLGREFLLPAGPVVLHRCTFEVGEQHAGDCRPTSRPAARWRCSPSGGSAAGRAGSR